MRCPHCLTPIAPTDWEPPSGLDPRMREYDCWCGTLSYIVLNIQEIEKELELELAQNC